MKLSNEGRDEGVTLSAPTAPNLKAIREQYTEMEKMWQDQRMPSVCQLLGEIIKYLEHREKRPPVYVHEPRLGPQPPSEADAIEGAKQLAEIIRVAEQRLAEAKADEGPKLCTTSGKPIDEHTREINPATGMQNDYIVLCAEERAKGFVRRVRRSYKHIGERPRYPLRDLTAEEQSRYGDDGYVKFEEYPESESPKTGRFWTQKDLQAKCGTVTTMGQALSETYARDPKFYGATFCCGCQTHLPVAEFIWVDDGQVVGS